MMPHFKIQGQHLAPSAIGKILENFDPISLGEMDEVKMMNRYDSKFLLMKAVLMQVLEEIKDDYYVLEIADTRIQSYNTIYYDTPDDRFYMAHHNGLTNRLKFRKREYTDSGIAFLEIKHKNNKGKTSKKRMEIGNLDQNLTDQEFLFLRQNSNLNGYKLDPKFKSRFKRITLVSKKLDERCTIDIDLHFKSFNGEKSNFRNMAIIELKQERQNMRSKLSRVLKDNHAYKQSFSKYCVGRALNEEELKSNVFKPEILQIRNQFQ